jgi:hypothetical protein
MRRFALYLLSALAIPTLGLAAVTKLPAEQRKVLQDATRFQAINSTKALPRAIVALCADHDGKLADPGQKWQVTDVVMERGLPSKRLVWAAVSGEYYVVHYEGGGIGHSYHVLVVTLPEGANKPAVIWHGTGSGPLKDYAEFLAALKSGKLDDTLDYSR